MIAAGPKLGDSEEDTHTAMERREERPLRTSVQSTYSSVLFPRCFPIALALQARFSTLSAGGGPHPSSVFFQGMTRNCLAHALFPSLALTESGRDFNLGEAARSDYAP